VVAALQELGRGAVRSLHTLPGGCINHVTRVDTERGPVLLKWNGTAPAGFFEAEAEGLRALGAAVQASGAPLIVPQPLLLGGTEEGSWLLTDYIERGDMSLTAFERLGHGLALVHGEASDKVGGEGGAAVGGKPPPVPRTPGWPTDNWIGLLPQVNGPAREDEPPTAHHPSAWAAFWAERRLRPQLAIARQRGFCDAEVFDEVLALVPVALPPGLPLGLLHGDFWSGNFMISEDRVPAIFDPAVYVGHGEVDLAMSELFQGFEPDFYAAYHEVRPISREYREFRKELYQLYYLLVHVNLFGEFYEALAYGAAARVVRALR
jgi:fructosamine-3-kinase